MGRTEYEDFAVQIHPVAGGEPGGERYAARLLDAAYGASETPCPIPIPRQELPALLARLGRQLHRPRHSAPSPHRDFRVADRAPGTDEDLPRRVGSQLFEALFRDAIARSWLKSESRVENATGGDGGRGPVGVRLRLVFDPQVPGADHLLNLPWELLYESGSRRFLALDPLSPVVRYLVVPGLRSRLPAPQSLRILVAVASPDGLPHLDSERECERLRRAWEGQPGVEVDTLPGATLGRLREALRRSPVHALHFIGHGDLDEETGTGHLLFEDGHGGPVRVSGSLLAAQLRGQRSLRLAFLNACESGGTARRPGQDPFTGVASALLMAGIPSVLAMQLPVSDWAALCFSRTFYTALAAGDGVDTAATEGRLAVLRDDPRSWEWAIPALFLSVPDGHLFHPPDPAPEPPTTTQGASDVSHDESRFNYSNFGDGNTIVGGDLHQAPDPRERASQQAEAGRQALEARQYRRAEERLRQALDRVREEPEEEADRVFHWALARLAGRRPRILARGEALELEENLEGACHLAPPPAHLLLLLALVKDDYFGRNGFRQSPPTADELLRRARGAPVDRSALARLTGSLPPFDHPIRRLIGDLAH